MIVSLEPLLCQRASPSWSIAQSRKSGPRHFAQLDQGGFQGRIVPVNPAIDELLGLKCFPSLRSCGCKIDLSLINVPAAVAASAVKDSIAAGAKAIVVVSAGFKETGPEGEERGAGVARICSEHGVRLLGPKSLGVINTATR